MKKKLVNVYDFDETIFDADTEFLFYNYLLTLDEVSDFHKQLIRSIMTDLSNFFPRCKYLYFISKDIKDFDKAINHFWDINEYRIKDFYAKQRKDDDIISSATPRFLLTPIQKRLGLKHLIATELDENFMPINFNKGEAKIFNLKAQYPNVEVDEFYSDSDSDLPLAYIAKKAFKVTGNKIEPWILPVQKHKPDIQELSFKNEDFKILNLTDIQIHLNEFTNQELMDDLVHQIDYLIQESRPDLIVLNGDQTYDGEEEILHFLSKLISSYNIPWAPIFGNHDSISYLGYHHLTLIEQGKLFQSYNNCLFKEGDRQLAYYPNYGSRLGNYTIDLKDKEKVVRRLIFVHSGNRDNYEEKDIILKNQPNYACLTKRQIEMIKKLSSDKNIPTTLFTHIPPFIYAKAANEAFNIPADYFQNAKQFTDLSRSISIADSYQEKTWREGFKNSFGVLHDHFIACPPINDHVYEELKDTSLDLIIAGHDHTNNFVINYHGLTLAYALKVGRACYYEKELQGGTLITIKKDSSFEIKHIYYKK